jgi:hypothetical protein
MNKIKACQVPDSKKMWNRAIRDAEEKIKGLQEAIGSFRAHRDAGKPWPGTQTETQTTESCHSV